MCILKFLDFIPYEQRYASNDIYPVSSMIYDRHQTHTQYEDAKLRFKMMQIIFCVTAVSLASGSF